MPGLSFAYDFRNTLASRFTRIGEALESLVHMPGYSSRVLAMDSRFLLAYTGYPEYPVRLVSLPDHLVVVEGRILGLSEDDIACEIKKLVSIIFSAEGRDEVRSWLMRTDGEFLIFVLRKQTGDVAILSDALGRLPCYFCNQEGILLFSREIRFVTSLITRREYDVMAIAQFLLFGYALGIRTFLENVQRLPPAFLLVINGKTGATSLTVLYTLNCEVKGPAELSVAENAKELSILFRESCQNRSADSSAKVVSLSGGLDSRAVAAGLQAVGAPFVGVTFIRSSDTDSKEAAVASRLAAYCGWDWEPYSLLPPSGKDVLELLRIKLGLNYLGMSFILPFFHRVGKTHGRNVTYFTGDGGDKLLPDLRPTFIRFRKLKGIANFIIHSQQSSSLRTVAALTRLDCSAIRKELVGTLEAYPEKEPSGKYVHFLIYERAVKWLFEGEDRNRFYFWTTSPFYSIRFFTYAMKCLDNQKRRYLLYRRFLENLSKMVTRVPEYASGFPLASRWLGLVRHAKLVLEQWLPLGLKNVIMREGSYSARSPLVRCLQRQLRECTAITTSLSEDALKEIIEHCQSYTKRELENLFTITSFIEYMETKHSSIEEYLDIDFS